MDPLVEPLPLKNSFRHLQLSARGKSVDFGDVEQIVFEPNPKQDITTSGSKESTLQRGSWKVGEREKGEPEGKLNREDGPNPPGKFGRVLHRHTRSLKEVNPIIKGIDFSHRAKILDLNDDDPVLLIDLDADMFIQDLKFLHPHHWDPLPCNVMWAWSQVDKQGTGVGSQKDMYRMVKSYNTYVSSNVNVERLIARFKRKKDHVLGEAELCSLLSDACSTPASADDARRVMARLTALARASTHGGYSAAISTDPFAVSRAVFEWWWIDAGHRAALTHRSGVSNPAASAPPPPPPPLSGADTALAARALGVDAGELDVNNICFEDMVALRSMPSGRRAPPAGLDLVRLVSQRVQQACAPASAALLGPCATNRR